MAEELVTLKIDDQEVKVPKGTNLIEAAKSIQVAVPYYCYHPDLSVVGNCRMCQLEVVGQPKLTIGCNTVVQEGMEVRTQLTSQKVKDAQAATLEFILINHPLDCTVCDQAGHCKLQDYHYEYNARPSRFLEEKVNKVKAEPLGPTVMLDGERCIMCTRCIRFCDEVTETSELGMLNRGDHSVISVNPNKVLDNPLSGNVVDLCPVGALTHSEWRFNTRIWFTKSVDTICPGCSTGCSAKLYSRDSQIVQVKGRRNNAVNKKWLCDEGRYGMQRFLPVRRLTSALHKGEPIELSEALRKARDSFADGLLVFVSPDLLLEDYVTIRDALKAFNLSYEAVVAYRERSLTDIEKILVSPDYAANFRGAVLSGLVKAEVKEAYEAALNRLRDGTITNLLLVGDKCIMPQDLDSATLTALRSVASSVAVLSDGASPIIEATKLSLPARSILEKSGLLINRALRLQYSSSSIEFPQGAEPEWRIFSKMAAEFGSKISTAVTDRDRTLELLASEEMLKDLSISSIKKGGVELSASGINKHGGESASA